MEDEKDEMEISINPEEKQINEKNNTVMKFISKHKGVFFLITLIVVLFVWATIRMNMMERRFEKQKTEIQTIHNQEIIAMNISQIESLSRVFALAVRNEQLRKNNEAVNQLFLNYSQLASTQEIILIDGESKKILISTDKTHEGIIFPNVPLHLPNQVTLFEDSFIRTISPLFGTNNKLVGILIIDYHK